MAQLKISFQIFLLLQLLREPRDNLSLTSFNAAVEFPESFQRKFHGHSLYLSFVHASAIRTNFPLGRRRRYQQLGYSFFKISVQFSKNNKVEVSCECDPIHKSQLCSKASKKWHPKSEWINHNVMNTDRKISLFCCWRSTQNRTEPWLCKFHL